MSDSDKQLFDEIVDDEEVCECTDPEMMNGYEKGISVFPAALLTFFTGVQFVLPLTFFILDATKQGYQFWRTKDAFGVEKNFLWFNLYKLVPFFTHSVWYGLVTILFVSCFFMDLNSTLFTLGLDLGLYISLTLFIINVAIGALYLFMGNKLETMEREVALFALFAVG